MAVVAQVLADRVGKEPPPRILQRARPHHVCRPRPPHAEEEQHGSVQHPVHVRPPVGRVLVGRGPVVAEPAPQRPRLGVGLDVVGHVLVADGVLVDAPVAEDMPQVDLLPAFDQLLRQVELLVEVGVPPLADGCRRLVPQLLDGRRGVDQGQLPHRLGVVQSEPEGHPGPDVVGHQPDALISQRAGQLVHIRRRRAGVVAGQGLVRVAEAPHVRRNGPVALPQDGKLVPPAVPELGPAVEEDDRLALPRRHVVDVYAVGLCRKVLPLHGWCPFPPR